MIKRIYRIVKRRKHYNDVYLVQGCPFCGRKPIIYKINKNKFKIGCRIGCLIKPISGYYKSRTEAYIDWNKRYYDPLNNIRNKLDVILRILEPFAKKNDTISVHYNTSTVSRVK